MSDSPDFLEEQEKNSGTKHANNRPMIIVAALMAIPLGFVAYGYADMWKEAYGERKVNTEEKKVTRYAVPAVTKPEGPDVVLPPSPPPEIFTIPPQQTQQQPFPQQPQGPAQIPDHIRERREALKAAMQADPTVPAFAQYSNAAMPMMPTMPPPPPPPDGYDQNRQEQQKGFLETQNNESPDLRHSKLKPRSDRVVMAGTMIPLKMLTGIDSGLAGQIHAQVDEDVYDTLTRRNALIPAGSKLIGTYDIRVSPGQERVLVAWNRIIFPDTSSINLDAMPGADRSGFAGMKDKVDNHYWRVFGHAFMVSLFSAATRLTQPSGGSGHGGYTAQEILQADIGRHMGQLGMQINQRNLNIPPTLEIRPGMKASLLTTKDMEL